MVTEAGLAGIDLLFFPHLILKFVGFEASTTFGSVRQGPVTTVAAIISTLAADDRITLAEAAPDYFVGVGGHSSSFWRENIIGGVILERIGRGQVVAEGEVSAGHYVFPPSQQDSKYSHSVQYSLARKAVKRAPQQGQASTGSAGGLEGMLGVHPVGYESVLGGGSRVLDSIREVRYDSHIAPNVSKLGKDSVETR